ncbi:RNA polymerase I-specific transcription initiation factor RRN3-like [Nycticebus coucang]|uniref:RNA polymerase I-specific transcription initiation factor RRN3-like n=1 Tax=Nycticebus coucang TaxID=9470 RepID=UPI00234CFA2C|nr:RNA polymerase I-specific transcription initiation factor RRN3-like [Nycticebus coucang]
MKLELIIERLLKLDVSASRQDIEDAEATATQTCVGTDSTEGLFNMDEDEETEHETKGDPERPDEMVHPTGKRLDLLLSLLLSYIKDVCYTDGKIDNNKTKDLYQDVINIFDKILLPTHASYHVQFFMFYLCSFKLGFAEAFLEHLWKNLQDPNNPAIIRRAAANYIGSFLARAKFIPLITLKSCLDLLVNWLHIYLNNRIQEQRDFVMLLSMDHFIQPVRWCSTLWFLDTSSS